MLTIQKTDKSDHLKILGSNKTRNLDSRMLFNDSEIKSHFLRKNAVNPNSERDKVTIQSARDSVQSMIISSNEKSLRSN